MNGEIPVFVQALGLDSFKPINELNGTISENDEQLGGLISMIVSTIEENFELTPKGAGSE
ncbi:hypothetical protein ACQKEK_10095 [Pseudomonas sp. NPDC077408]